MNQPTPPPACARLHRTLAPLALVLALPAAAFAWEVRSTDNSSTNPGAYGMNYVVEQINRGNGNSEINLVFDDAQPYYLDCTAVVTSRFAYLRTQSGDVVFRYGTLTFDKGANLTDCTFSGYRVICRDKVGTVDGCAFWAGELNLNNDYTIQNSSFSNTALYLGNGNVIAESVQWHGDNSPMVIHSNNVIRAGRGLDLCAYGSSNRISGVHFRSILAYESGNRFVGNTNAFNQEPYRCEFQGSNHVIVSNVFYSAQQGPVEVYGDDNLIADNLIYSNEYGLYLEGRRNTVRGNRIGLMPDGITPAPNAKHGLWIIGEDNTVGGTNNPNAYWREGNVIAANDAGGILFGTNARYNYADGNLIGLVADGTDSIANLGHGVHVRDGYNQVGVLGGNTICGNQGDGIRFDGKASGWGYAIGNYIGITRVGQTPLGNSGSGIAAVNQARYNHIGRTRTNGFNVIGGNGGDGVYIGPGCAGNTVAGNYIGFPREFENNTVNDGAAVRLEAASDTWVGGVSPDEGNVLDGRTGLALQRTTNSWVYDNTVGFDTNQAGVSSALNIGLDLDGAVGDRLGQYDAHNRVGGAWEAAVRMQNCRQVRFAYLDVGYGQNALGEVVTNTGVGMMLSNSTDCTIEYCRIGGSGGGIAMENTASNNIQGCFIGAPDNDPFKPLQNDGPGVLVVNGRGDRIGADYWPQNIIAGNRGNGVELRDCAGVRVQGNHIGLDEAGTAVVPNQGHGVYIRDGEGNVVGGEAAYRNYIAGNAGDGVHIDGDGSLPRHVVAANRIGLFVPGLAAATNGGHGIALQDAAGIVVGGTNAGNGNICGGNLGHGIVVSGALSDAHAILGNRIGTDADGTRAVPNGGCGVALRAGGGHTVAGNLLAGNAGDGLLIEGAAVCEVDASRNRIGTRLNGREAVPNGGSGIRIVDAPTNYILENLISGNAGNGIAVSNSAPPYNSARNNLISGNWIGTDADGLQPLGNGDNGILLHQVTFTRIGAQNVIAANTDDGIEIRGLASHDNFIQGNVIGGATNLGNIGHGIQLHGGDANRVGSTNAWEANEISYNLVHGVAVFTGNRNGILGNSIYSNGWMGIRLGTNDTPHPPAWGPGYPNNHQNAPVLTNARAGSLRLEGYLESGASQPYLLEFFLSDKLNPAGYGEGRLLLAREWVVADTGGRAPFSIDLEADAPTGALVTATATDTNRNTSAFSYACEITGGQAAPPAAPSGLQASQGDYDKVRLAWTGSAGAADYELFRSVSPDPATAAPIGRTAADVYDDRAAAPDMLYHYWVQARNAAGASVFSAPAAGYRRPAAVLHGLSAADFDGDGRADPAIYDARTGTWTVKLSGGGYATSVFTGLLGGPGWLPAPADYDGDGLTDPAVYQESAGNWKILQSGIGYAPLQRPAFLGGSGWLPACADYDGDGLADYAVYRESAGNWHVKLSSGAYALLTYNELLGGPGWSPASADYDGDGLADPAAYHRAEGSWKVLMSGGAYAPLTLPAFLGGRGWSPVPGDYDGDGLADPAVRKDGGSLWRARLSGSGYAPADVPLGL